MDLIYSMKRKPLKCEPPHCDSSTDPEVVRPLVSISSANIIAFTSLTELSDVEGDTWGGHVYVCDLDTPWDAHKVMSGTYPISAIAWDVEGNKLMVANTIGDVSVYGQKDFLLNEWQCIYTATFPGEHIIKCAFFHNGRRVVSLDKKPEAPIADRIQMLRNAPTLKGFGGVPMEGGIVVTRSGLVGVVVYSDGAVASSTQSLRPCRPKVDHAALTYSIDGKIMVSVICRRMVVCAACVVARSPPEISLQPLPAVSLPAAANPSCVWWWGEALGVGGSNVELWRCTDRQHPLHDVLIQGGLQGNTTPGGGQKPPEFFNTVWWSAGGAWASEGGAAVGGAAPLAPRPPAAAAVTPTSLMLLHQDSARLMTVRLAGGAEPAGAAEPKKARHAAQNATLCAVDMSQAGAICVCIDTHSQLHVLAIHRDMPSSVLVQQAVAQLETAGVAGYSCADVILQAPPDTREAIYERFVESFQRQPAAFQQHYYHSWLKIRIALCRSVARLQTSGSWLTCVQTSGAALAAAGAALRHDDRADAVQLDDDDDKSVSALEAKVEAAVEAGGAGGALPWGGAGAGAAAALRAVLHRAADVALAALAHLPHQHHHHHGYEIWSEPGATSTLRRLVAVWRGAGGGGGAAGGAAGGAGAAALARLLAAAAQQRLLHTHKQDLLDECVALSAQWTQPRIWESLPRCNMTSPHAHPTPHSFEYGVEPESLRYVPEPPPYGQACETTPSVTMDSIRYMHLGGGARPARWRQCGRCGARAFPAACTARHPLQKAFDSRFIANCRCGGKWTLCSNI